ncbi:MAG: hypothetical protein M1831_003640 [Alyxoria varia]|nr:MAG: hypothetical protein M1831_003640 [Alyxoria varia]
MEASMPSPPPPYSAAPQSGQPSRREGHGSPEAASYSQTMSPSQYGNEFTPISATASSSSGGGMPSSFQRPGSTTPSNSASPVVYPPPPPPPSNQRDRSTSRSRFNLSLLTSRHRYSNTNSPNSAMDTLQQQTTQALSRTPVVSPGTSAPTVVPPTARRAASAGCIESSPIDGRRPSGDATPATETSGNHGFAIPPPPPGPPPTNRSQSASRAMDRANQSPAANPSSFTASGPSRVASRGNQLDPIPPTPADWVDEDIPRQYTTRVDRNTDDAVHPETSIRQTSVPPASDSSLRDNSTSGGIRERRNQSRANRVRSESTELSNQTTSTSDQQEHDTESATPADLVLAEASGSLSRRRRVSKTKTSPLYKESPSPIVQRGPPDSGVQLMSEPGSAPASTSMSSPQSSSKVPNSARSSTLPQNGGDLFNVIKGPSAKPIKSLPPSPTSHRRRNAGSLTVCTSSKAPERPISQISQYPNKEEAMPKPVVPSRPSSSKGEPRSKADDARPSFAQECLERHRLFVEQEAQARSDTERLELFAAFVVNESRLRRDKYAEAFEVMGSGVLDLTRDMWRSHANSKKPKPAVVPQPVSGRATPNRPLSGDHNSVSEPPSAQSNSDSAAFTPQTEPDSPSNASGQQLQARSNSQQRQNTFQPCLSPIPSMAVSTVPDDLDSRGRTPSRWWEASTEGGSTGGAPRLERSKRESKYMGLPREARENLQWDIPEHPAETMATQYQHYGMLGPDEYPQEKVGWHGEDGTGNASDPMKGSVQEHRTPKLDISRLVTLPPPYPRHHPAVNNNHPDLAALRSSLRQLNDRDDVTSARDRYATRLATITKNEPTTTFAERKREVRRRIQEQLSIGTMTFADAAKEEANFEARESKRHRDQAQKIFDEFQSHVLGPANAQFSDKMSKASAAIDQLKESLNYEARSNNPNQTQEEGDEQPELLEKLTLMKWFHEAREQLHQDMFELEGESDEQYKKVILTPYHDAGNHEKIREVESFFRKDSQDRKQKYESEALKRTEAFLQVVEENVTRGVEVQLSAFWDIAPSLLEVIQKVPIELDGFDIEVPQQEYDENPSYHDFPAQYLYTLLLHAKSAAYQFIESQTNLLCLLHEIKSGVMAGGCRVLETQRLAAGEEPEVVEEEMQEIQRGEDASLTADLKERVGLVEEQWRQALGKGLEDLEDRIKTFLFENGGWDEGLEE